MLRSLPSARFIPALFALSGLSGCEPSVSKERHDSGLPVDLDADDDGYAADVDCDDEDADVGDLLIVATSVRLTSAASFADFCPDAPGCRVAVDGDLTIAPQDRPDPDDSDGEAECGRTVPDSVSSAKAESLTSLTCLVEVHGSLDVWANGSLPSLEGLENLSVIGDTLIIEDNDALSDLRGLEGLSSVDVIQINANDTLTTLAGLDAAGEMVSELEISDNYELTEIGTATAIAAGELLIYDNPRLVSLAGLSPMGSASRIYVQSNEALVDLGAMGTLTSIRGDLTIGDNGSLTSLSGLSALDRVGGDLNLSGNGSLTSLSGLGALTSVGGELNLSGNEALTSLSGLGALTSVGGELNLSGNEALTSLSGLDALASVGADLMVRDDPSLSDVSALLGLDALGGAMYLCPGDALPSAERDALADAVASIGGEVDSDCLRAGDDGTLVGTFTEWSVWSTDPDAAGCEHVWEVGGTPSSMICEYCDWTFDVTYSDLSTTGDLDSCGAPSEAVEIYLTLGFVTYYTYGFKGGSYDAEHDGILVYPYSYGGEIDWYYTGYLTRGTWNDMDGELVAYEWGYEDEPVSEDGATWYETSLLSLQAVVKP